MWAGGGGFSYFGGALGSVSVNGFAAMLSGLGTEGGKGGSLLFSAVVHFSQIIATNAIKATIHQNIYYFLCHLLFIINPHSYKKTSNQLLILEELSPKNSFPFAVEATQTLPLPQLRN